MAVDYNKLAAQQYDPGYNQKITALKNQLADQLASYDSSKTGINTNYNNQVDTQNLTNVKNKNTFSNNMLNRGIARSTVATSGLAGLDSQNTRLLGDINTARTGALNEVENQKSLAQKAYGTTVAGLNSDRLDAIASLARQLKQTDWDNDYKNRQLAQEKALALAQIRASRASSAANKSTSDAEDWQNFNLGLIDLVDGTGTEDAKISQLNTLKKKTAVMYNGKQLKEANAQIDKAVKDLYTVKGLKARTTSAQSAATSKASTSNFWNIGSTRKDPYWG